MTVSIDSSAIDIDSSFTSANGTLIGGVSIDSTSVVAAPPHTPTHWWDFTDSTSVTAASGIITDVADKGTGAIDIEAASGEEPELRSSGSRQYAALRGSQKMSPASALTIDEQSHTAIVFSSAHNGGDIYLLGGAAWSFYWRDIGSSHGLAFFDTGPDNSTIILQRDSPTSPTEPIVNDSVYGVKMQYLSSSASDVILGDGVTEDDTLTPMPAGTSALNWLFARGDGNVESSGDHLGVMLFDSALSSAELAEMAEWGRAYYGNPTAAKKDVAVIWDGDSLTAGYNAQDYENTTSAPAQFSSLYNTLGARMVNIGLDGDRLNLDTAATKAISTLSDFSGYTKRIVVVWLGTNDIYVSGDSAATVSGNLDTYIASIRAADAGAIVVGMTVIARGSSIDADVAAYNSHILSTADFDYTVDLASLSMFDAAADTADTDYYIFDRIHLTENGYREVALAVYSAISSELPSN